MAGATDRPDPAQRYKLAFDVKSTGPANAVNPALIGIARIINTLRQQGVAADHIEATAVFHGPTIAVVTKNETYRNRTGAKANPNLGLLRELAAAGVKFVICGVSAAEQNYTRDDMVPEATMNMSATLTFIDLGLKGYVKVER
ncbi:DsrE family protein [Sphingomonas sp.]|uniref:DsrE family protein n=1 Tax=Sphingomonas sp. TaxID=28214 RepID=UPI0025E22F58|nr:DsrE family protein [Sphingomonas sp.]